MDRQDQYIDVGRRSLLGELRLGAVGAAILGTLGPVGAALVAAPAQAQTSGLSDIQLMSFLLQFQYVEAEFYLRAVTGQGLSAADTGGTGTVGIVNGGAQVPFTNPLYAQVAVNLASDEQQHVRFLRSTLATAVTRPATIAANSPATGLHRVLTAASATASHHQPLSSASTARLAGRAPKANGSRPAIRSVAVKAPNSSEPASARWPTCRRASTV